VPILESHELIGFVDGSEPCPSKFIDDNPEDSSHSLNPDYILWNKKDQCVLSWINATLSDKVLASLSMISHLHVNVWIMFFKRLKIMLF
jgi:hypothetical protein